MFKYYLVELRLQKVNNISISINMLPLYLINWKYFNNLTIGYLPQASYILLREYGRKLLLTASFADYLYWKRQWYIYIGRRDLVGEPAVSSKTPSYMAIDLPVSSDEKLFRNIT
jgi:hypothetical protein